MIRSVTRKTMSDLHLPMSTEDLIRQLRQSPGLPLIVQEFQAVLDAEREKREQFYRDMREGDKVEFINGQVIVHTPVKLRHSQASDNLFALMKAFVQKHDLGIVGHEKLLVSLTRNDYEPDICFFGVEKARALAPDQTHFPAPDLIVEVLSDSTEGLDRGIKFEDYALHGVGEYWLVDAAQETVEQYALEAGRYELIIKARTGTIASRAIAGFEIPVRAIFDAQEQMAALREILK